MALSELIRLVKYSMLSTYNQYIFNSHKITKLHKSLMLMIFYVLIFVLKIQAQTSYSSLGGANFLGYARTGVNIQGIESVYLNQAGLVGVKSFGVDVSIEQRFGLSELTQSSLAIAKNTKYGVFGAVISNFGFEEFNEQKFGLAYAKRLSPIVSIGGQFDVLRRNISSLGSTNGFTGELGIIVDLNKEFQIASHLFSPVSTELSDGDDIGTRFRIGLKYQPSQKVFLLGEVDKVVYRQIEYKFALGYQASTALQFRLGANPSTSTFCFGASFQLKNTYKASAAYSLHSQLGNTSALSIQYNK